MVTVGLVGVGAMGSALGAGWAAGGARVLATLAGRSPRTRALAAAAGIEALGGLAAVVAAADVVVSVVPPGAAVAAATDIAAAAAATGATPLVVDLNAIAPATLSAVAAALAPAGCDLVDGSISGGPPSAGGPPLRVYVCGPRAGELAALPHPWLDLVVLPGAVGAASALKMCTAAMYKGFTALTMHAMLTADEHGVLAEFLADTARQWPDNAEAWPPHVALSATKAWRYVDEMHEIAATQAAAGLPPDLYAGIAAAWARAATTRLGALHPEQAADLADLPAVLAALRPDSG